MIPENHRGMKAKTIKAILAKKFNSFAASIEDESVRKLVEKNTIIPDRPSYYRDGIVGHEFIARKNHISRTNDGIGIFNLDAGLAGMRPSSTATWSPAERTFTILRTEPGFARR